MTITITVVIKEHEDRFTVKTSTVGDQHTVMENMIAHDIVDKINDAYSVSEESESEWKNIQ